ncbi:ATP-dependent zinc protease family protein [Hugenholtzia roseola]|uniref:ATP-dependent zinc protease family protein n=1 Tax=Hugenholtzia roseola TaxID=1002 RepID=UPI000688ABF4|nr:RimK/LysX family protein [Hugenholtzia roseola]
MNNLNLTDAKKSKTIIGRIERIALPDLALFQLDAKIDTGAYTSSLHCHSIQVLEKDGGRVLSCFLLDPSHPAYQNEPLFFKKFAQTRVKSSNGQLQERFKVKTQMQLGNHLFKVEFTLNDRSDMRYPILLGRKVLSKRFLVDVAKKYCL